jgi:hypothetical protein
LASRLSGKLARRDNHSPEHMADIRQHVRDERGRYAGKFARILQHGTILDLVHAAYPEFEAESWSAWRVFLKALFALELSGEELETFRRLTGRNTAPAAPAREAWGSSRRGGKSRAMALVAVHLTTCRAYRLAPGEVGVFPSRRFPFYGGPRVHKPQGLLE